MNDWWMKSVVYQIYPRSFCDSNGDGIGDINGIALKLEYLKELGVDVIWLSPVYESPMRDNGYDISDYRAINPEFGTMEDFGRMLHKAHSLDLKVVMDLVVNHTSDKHAWFAESRKGIDSAKRDYYIWRDGKDGGPPNDWRACFSGPAWTKDDATGQYYLHLFSPYQPDLNWENPDVRRDVYSTMRWWLDKGIDGFRMDVINLISKPQNFPGGGSWTASANGPRVHEFLREMRREVLDGYDIMTVGETPEVTVEQAIQYASLDGKELNMVFQFEHMMLDCDNGSIWTGKKAGLAELKEVLSRWQTGLSDRGWNSLYFNNHDRPRSVSRYGDDGEYREKSAKMLATCLHFMQGTPFIYQGEELGMTNVPYSDINDYRDIESLNAYNILVEESKYFSKETMLRYLALKSRDNARTPMHWNNGTNAGFSKNAPWIMLNPNYININAEDQMNRLGSVFKYYQKLIKLRKEMDIITYGDFELLLPEHSDLFAYTRGYQNKRLLVVCNFSREERTFVLPEGFTGKSVLIENDETHRTYTTELSSHGYRPKPCVVLGAFGAVVYRRY